MAKEKTKEKEIKVKERVEKIHEKHLTKLQNIVNSMNALQFNIGKMEVNKFNAMGQLNQTQNDITEMQSVLLREYGSYDVNLNDGTINWPSDKVEKNGVEPSATEKPKKDEK